MLLILFFSHSFWLFTMFHAISSVCSGLLEQGLWKKMMKKKHLNSKMLICFSINESFPISFRIFFLLRYFEFWNFGIFLGYSTDSNIFNFLEKNIHLLFLLRLLLVFLFLIFGLHFNAYSRYYNSKVRFFISLEFRSSMHCCQIP